MRKFLDAPTSRMLLIYGTGCGKTPTAIRCAFSHFRREMSLRVTQPIVPRILVVCPALVRRHWCREFMKWEQVEALPIEMGRRSKSGSKAAKELRKRAYQARIQVVSYDLLREIEPKGWDYLIIDEIHHLRDPMSKQSRAVATLLKLNPAIPTLGLSATLIPTVIKQVWNPLRLLFGQQTWGHPSRTGGISWKFAEEYCGIEQTDYGCSIGNGIPEKLDELKKKISRVSHRLTRTDIAADLPALNVRMLDVPGMRSDLADTAVQWVDQLGSDVRKVVLITYHRSLATSLVQTLSEDPKCTVLHIDGALSTTERDEILQRCETLERVVLVTTSEAIKEGVRLMWAEQVLLVEWRQAPAQVIQLLGRFQSVGDPRKPQIDILFDESLISEATTLVNRISQINTVLGSGETERMISETFTPKELTPNQITSMTLDLFADVERSLATDLFSENEDQDHE